MEKQKELDELQDQVFRIMDEAKAMVEAGRPESEIIAHSKQIEPLNQRMKQLSSDILEEGQEKLALLGRRKRRLTVIYVVFVSGALLLMFLKVINS